jgi:hypothetical protein
LNDVYHDDIIDGAVFLLLMVDFIGLARDGTRMDGRTCCGADDLTGMGFILFDMAVAGLLPPVVVLNHSSNPLATITMSKQQQQKRKREPAARERSSRTYVRKILRDVNEEPAIAALRASAIEGKSVGITAEALGALSAVVDEEIDTLVRRGVEVCSRNNQGTLSAVAIEAAIRTRWGDEILPQLVEAGMTANRRYTSSFT